ncbi:MAG: LysR family transcriptional regulator, partial [Firmicutes bacterium]|nr:LysR family transcriptional regulator [Bacillota bacterium]
MELLQLRYFQKVAELESVTKAARYFSIPQPSMSQAIGRLERDLNTRLFERRNGKLFLNEKGRAFLEAVERSLQELDNGMATITGDAGKISGPINIKVMENHRFILASIPKFAKMYPDVRISVSHGYYEDQDVSYDLCISSKPSYKHMTASVPLIRERVVLAVHEDHPFASREAVSIADLQGQKLISLPAPTELYEQTLKLCRARGFEPLIPIICDDPYFVRKYVSENMGIALAPSISW